MEQSPEGLVDDRQFAEENNMVPEQIGEDEIFTVIEDEGHASAVDVDEDHDAAAGVEDVVEIESADDEENVTLADLFGKRAGQLPEEDETDQPVPSVAHTSSHIDPIEMSKVDKVARHSMAEAATIAKALEHASSTTKHQKKDEADAAPAKLSMAMDAKVAVHKGANIFFLMMAAMVENNRKEALVAATTAAAAAKSERRKGSAAATALAEAQKKYKSDITAKDIEAALIAAGYKHLLPQLANKKRSRD